MFFLCVKGLQLIANIPDIFVIQMLKAWNNENID